MDHLPWREADPLNPRGRPQVPLLCHDETDICDNLGDFEIWDALKDWDFSTSSPIEAASRYQAWLFFGLLRMLTKLNGQTFRLGDWISEHDSRYIDSTLLAEMLDGLRAKFFEKERFAFEPTVYLANDGRDIFAGVKAVLGRCSASIKRIIHKYERIALSDDLNSNESEYLIVFWSILLLYDHFCEWSLDVVSGGDEGMIFQARSKIPTISRESTLFVDFVRRTGRCPTVLFRKGLRSTDIYRLLAMPLTMQADHSTCDGRYCKKFNITERDYVMQHLHGGCDCEMVGISSDTLKNLVEKARIPLVLSSLDAQGKLAIEIVDATNVEDYVAISHVWAGGLGNFTNNAHYECQLIQLHLDVSGQLGQQSSRQITRVHYWLDTLCIPSEQGSSKIKAMDAMAAIYAGAKTVLVLDPDLRQLHSRDLSVREMDTAIFISPWMARSWTLQEGALAVDLSLKFKDRVITCSAFETNGLLMSSTIIGAVWNEAVEHVMPFCSPGAIIERYALIETLGMPIPHPPHERYLSAWNQLCERSTTKPEDIAAIFAALLDRNTGEVLQIPHEKRMQAFLGTLSKLPVSILFAPTITDAPVWSPSFPSCSSGQYGLSTEMGYMDAEASGEFALSGLRHLRLLEIPQGLPTSGHCTAFYRDHNLCYHLYFVSCTSKGKVPWQANVVLLLSTIKDHTTSAGRFHGIVLERLIRDDNELHVRFLRAVEWYAHKGTCDSPLSASSSQPHTTSSRETSMRIEIASSINETDITPENRLYIDLGASTWPTLQWSRPDFYPFIETGVRLAQPLYLFVAMAAGSCIYAGVLSFTGIVNSCFNAPFPGWLWRSAVYLLLATILIWSRWRLAHVEYQFFRAQTHRMLQKFWVLSFLPDVNNYNDIHRIRSMNPATLMILALIYSTLLTCSTVGVSYFLFDNCQKGPSDCITNILSSLLGIRPVQPSIVLIVLKPICFTVWFELVGRVVSLAYLHLWKIWRRSSSSSEGVENAYVFETFTWLEALEYEFFPWVIICLMIGFVVNLLMLTTGSVGGWILRILIVSPCVTLLLWFCFEYYITPRTWITERWKTCRATVKQWTENCRLLFGRLLGRHDREIQLPAGDLDLIPE